MLTHAAKAISFANGSDCIFSSSADIPAPLSRDRGCGEGSVSFVRYLDLQYRQARVGHLGFV
jgi:hypothetical protein